MTKQAPTFETPKTNIEMSALISIYNRTTSAAKRKAIEEIFDHMACQHGYITGILGTDYDYRWNGIDWISRVPRTHTC